MKHIAVAAVAFVFAASSAWAQSLPQSPIRVAQAGSCSTWNATCQSRCADAACRKNNCGSKMSACLSNGCWTEGAAHGGARHCGLVKK